MTLEDLREALLREGGTLAEVVDGATAGRPALRVQGGRVTGREGDYELLLEMILEGARLHYGQPHVVHSEDPDLALLLGDQLYALGLARLAALGDLEAVAELADVISLVAQAQAAADPALAQAVWEAGVAAIACGADSGYEAAKALARIGDPAATVALRQWSARR